MMTVMMVVVRYFNSVNKKLCKSYGRRRKLADWAIMHFASITSGPQQGNRTCAYKAPTKCIILRASLILRLRVYFITPRLIVLPVYTLADTGAYITGFIDISPQKSVCIRLISSDIMCIASTAPFCNFACSKILTCPKQLPRSCECMIDN